MKKLTCFLAILLAVCMMTSVFVSCAETTDPAVTPAATPSATATAVPSATAVPTGEEETVNVSELIKTFPQKSFSGEEFLIAASSTYENVFTITQFPTESDMNGDLVHDALYGRDRLIEEYFSLTLAYNDMLDSSMVSKLSNGIRSGDDVYSLILGTLRQTAVPFFNSGLLYDLAEMSVIDLTQPWWNSNSIDNFQINGRIYMATGAITNRYVYAPYAMLFNTRLIEASDLTNPYTLVDEGTWTLEAFCEMIENAYRDENGNDSVDLQDFYGLAPASDSETAYFFACGCHFAEKDGDDLTLTLIADKNFEVLERVALMMKSDDVLSYQATYDSNHTFNDGRAIFHSTALCDITMLNEMEDSYGIVPMPKYDEEQEEYYSNPNRSISTMALLPSSIADPDSAALIVEALAAVSQYTSLDKQYESVLLNRQALDAESKRNLQLVVESISYDWGYICDIGGVSEAVRQAIKAGKTDFSSLFEAQRDKAQAALDKIAAKFEE